MANKKHYHYDKEQFVDREGKLYFLITKYPDETGTEVYLLVDIYDQPRIYFTLMNLTPVLDTYKFFVLEQCRLMDVGHNNPLGFSKSVRNEVIHNCLTKAYKSVKEEHRPSVENLGEVFKMSQPAVFNTMKRHFQVTKINGLGEQ